jgi:hypothetical protein
MINPVDFSEKVAKFLPDYTASYPMINFIVIIEIQNIDHEPRNVRDL